MQLPKEDLYMSDMSDLAQTYSKCSVESLVEADADDDDEELKIIHSDMETVRKLFLL